MCFLFAGDPCTVEGSTRLIGGASDMEGRVEYCNNGRWGTVCNSIGWDSLDAMVVCRELGHYALGMHLRSRPVKCVATITCCTKFTVYTS